MVNEYLVDPYLQRVSFRDNQNIPLSLLFFCDGSMDTNANNSSVEYDQGLVDDDAQSISNTSISSHGSYAVGLDVPDITGNWGFLAPFSVEDSDSEDYGDALATEDYELPYTDNLPSAITESNTHRQTIDSAYPFKFDTVSEADLAAFGSSSPVCFVSPVSRQNRRDSVSSENEGANTPRPARQQTPSSWYIVDHVRGSREGWLKDPNVTFIRRTVKKKVGFMPKPWQVDVIINTVYEQKDIVVSAGTGSGKSLPYTLIPLIKPAAIVLVLSPTIALMNDQV